MKKILILFLAGMIGAVSVGCPKDDGEIVVIIEDPTYDDGGNGSDNGERPPDVDTTEKPRPPRDTSDKPPRIETREMSLTAAVGMLERDLTRGDLERLRRHTDALEEAVNKVYEKTKDGSRKRTLNLITVKLRGFKKSLAEIEDEEIPEAMRLELKQDVGELEELAERVEG
ncbi:hypothetical protein JXM67_15065 [candidate division WOR-3 bacterium]|nr:hypothetical protein [candidate division WOR-3 bacterium]